MISNVIPEINKEPLKKQAANYIRELIFSNTLIPGDRIIPGKIAADLKIGRGAVREALMLLETEGLVKNLPYSGSFVALCSTSELHEICSVRVMLETYAIKKQFNQITDEDYYNLKTICDSIKMCIEQNNMADMLKYDALFHGYFVKKESQSILFDAWDISTSKISVLYFSLLNTGYSMHNTAENHYKLLEQLHVSLEAYINTLDEHYMKVGNHLNH